MRLFSNPGSVRRGEPSVLAIMETVAASGLSFWLAWRLASIQHIVLASALAPFLLCGRDTGLLKYLARRFGRGISAGLNMSFGEHPLALITPCRRVGRTADDHGAGMGYWVFIGLGHARCILSESLRGCY